VEIGKEKFWRNGALRKHSKRKKLVEREETQMDIRGQRKEVLTDVRRLRYVKGGVSQGFRAAQRGTDRKPFRTKVEQDPQQDVRGGGVEGCSSISYLALQS